MLGTVSRAYVLVAYAAFLQRGSCANAPTHIRLCQDACRNVIRQDTSHAGFLFKRCKLSPRTRDKSSSGATDKTTTAECLSGRPSVSGGDVTVSKHKSMTCRRNKGFTTRAGPSIKESTLLVLPETTPVYFWNQMNLSSKTIKRFRVPCKIFLMAFVYIRKEQRFLFSSTAVINSFNLNANTDLVIVRRISWVAFMRYDEDKQIVFLSQSASAVGKFHVSRMTAGGDEYRLVTTTHGRSYIALDTKKALVYVATYGYLFQMSYDGEENKTVAEERHLIRVVTIDAKFSSVYYIVGDTLMKLMRDGQRSVILKLTNTRFLRIGHFEFQSNTVYASNRFLDTSIFSITLTRNPVLKSHHVGSEKEKWLLYLV